MAIKRNKTEFKPNLKKTSSLRTAPVKIIKIDYLFHTIYSFSNVRFLRQMVGCGFHFNDPPQIFDGGSLSIFILEYLHFSKTSLDEPLDVHLCSYFHEQHCVTRRDVIQT